MRFFVIEVLRISKVYWNKLISVDFTGTALCLKYELQQMIKQGQGGSIIVTGTTLHADAGYTSR